MDIRHLEYFVEVARCKSFTKAARNLYITQPTISKMVKQMEDELGVVLFERLAKSVEITDAGKAIYLQVQNIVNSFHNLSSELEAIVNVKRGNIRIGLPPMVGSSFFPQIMGMFCEAYPNITIQLWEDGAKKVAEDVANGSLDIGVTLLPLQEDIFDSFPFVRDDLKLVVHTSHPLAQSSAATLAELAGEDFILFHENFLLHDRIINECMHAGFKPRVHYEGSQWDFVCEMVAANLGIALLPSRICRGLDEKRVSIISLTEPVIPWNLAMIWRKDRYLSFAAREWIMFTQKLLREAMDSSI